MRFGVVWGMLLAAAVVGGQNLTVKTDPGRPSENLQKLLKRKESEAKLWIASETGLQWLATVYSPHKWNPNSLPGAKNISGQCKSSMKIYLMALAKGVLWAAKASDASGRYSSQFFFGNDFWLGSQKLCSEITPEAPFPVAFHLVKFSLVLDKEFTPKARDMSLGVCLPEACSSDDIKSLLEATNIPPDANHNLTLLRIRPVPGSYTLATDPKVHIMLSVSIIVFVLMAVGTVYEWILERRRRKCHVHRANNNESAKMDKITFDKEELSKSESDLMATLDPCKGMGKFGEIVLSFSVLTNGRKILECGTPSKDSISCVHGLRFFSLAWVIMVHTYLQVFAIAENKRLRTLAEETFGFQTVSNATFSVDSFFFISGLLVSYLYFKGTSKPEREQTIRTPRAPRPFLVEMKIMALKYFTLLGYRFIRLTPAYLFVLGMTEVAMRWIKNNSVFEPVSMDNVNCAKYWWRNALYINSLFPRKEMCMLWSWYLSNDTQFYVLGIMFLLISSKFFRVAATSLVLILLSSCVTTAIISVYYDHIVSIQQPFILFDELYDKPWTRLGPYLIGMFTGYFLYRTRGTIKISKVVSLIGWIIALSVLISLVYGVLGANLGITGSALYAGLGHTAWGAALAWIVVACTAGMGGCVNSLLSCRLLQPLSRLTYCAYLIHPVIMVLTSFQMDGPLHLSTPVTFILYFGNMVAAFLASFFISLAFEAPTVRLLKVCLSPVMAKQNN
ncbi:nose resistant to fluoxetine protein 6-like [Cimex lectularius]|uniref:Nose resistant-to-fluoxetine protein N-terminal domain-containing protein n=1 Tax=Cimex lectularius TaxID=79782 RepID=A0A8I6S0A1_CIMLE|nr:nose resistant to fluoxetine protein 6-like [Cimex lectularius]XP_014254662.1 nose resistant to fluoxetine protein 6-like [Cimex lectularius]